MNDNTYSEVRIDKQELTFRELADKVESEVKDLQCMASGIVLVAGSHEKQTVDRVLVMGHGHNSAIGQAATLLMGACDILESVTSGETKNTSNEVERIALNQHTMVLVSKVRELMKMGSVQSTQDNNPTAA
jgi:co-chaperonin GroES (HSP10)